eukprot:GHVO01036917.1.p1 GENE.GHVO01036917.1~~GHVO01036917.1.p1  ORF type:complete len:279 (+),score=35.16 GHVO01036917.1:90-926(+)
MDAHKNKCLTKNTVYLNKNLSMSSMFLAWLSQEGVTTREHVEILKNKMKRESRASAVSHFLNNILPIRGAEAFDSFLIALRESNQGFIADELKKWMTKNPLVEKKQTVPYDEIITEIDGKNLMDMDSITAQGQKKKTGECYGFPHKTSLAVVINNVDFDDKEVRKGSHYDVINIRNLLNKLKFPDVMEKTNLNAQGMRDYLEKDVREKLKERPDVDAFVAVIMSHGSKGCVLGTDLKEVKIEDIVSMFNGNNCPELKDKPKLFFVQACQTGESSKCIT